MGYDNQRRVCVLNPKVARQMKSITPTNANATPIAKALREFESAMLCLHCVDSNHYDRFVSLEKQIL